MYPLYHVLYVPTWSKDWISLKLLEFDTDVGKIRKYKSVWIAKESCLFITQMLLIVNFLEDTVKFCRNIY